MKTGHFSNPGDLVHEFKNQLGIILGFTELLLAEMAPGDKYRSDVEEIEKAAKAAMELVRKLKTMAGET
jgi:signal transduction histidine kinase